MAHIWFFVHYVIDKCDSIRNHVFYSWRCSPLRSRSQCHTQSFVFLCSFNHWQMTYYKESSILFSAMFPPLIVITMSYVTVVSFESLSNVKENHRICQKTEGGFQEKFTTCHTFWTKNTDFRLDFISYVLWNTLQCQEKPKKGSFYANRIMIATNKISEFFYYHICERRRNKK